MLERCVYMGSTSRTISIVISQENISQKCHESIDWSSEDTFSRTQAVEVVFCMQVSVSI